MSASAWPVRRGHAIRAGTTARRHTPTHGPLGGRFASDASPPRIALSIPPLAVCTPSGALKRVETEGEACPALGDLHPFECPEEGRDRAVSEGLGLYTPSGAPKGQAAKGAGPYRVLREAGPNPAEDGAGPDSADTRRSSSTLPMTSGTACPARVTPKMEPGERLFEEPWLFAWRPPPIGG